MKDKDIDRMLSTLPKNVELMLCPMKNKRGMAVKEMIKAAERNRNMYRSFESIENAIKNIDKQKTLITGSFYCVSEARKIMKMEGSEEN